MKAPNISPGPWETTGEHIGAAGFRAWVKEHHYLGGELSVCQVNHDHPALSGGMSREQASINHKAIMSLPQVLKALEPFADCIEGSLDGFDDEDHIDPPIKAKHFKDAIAALKAAGYTF